MVKASNYGSDVQDVRSSYAASVKAFLQRDYVACILDSQRSVALLSAHKPITDAGMQQVLERVLLLRLTAFTTVYGDSPARERVLSALRAGDSQEEALAAANLLAKPPAALGATLWSECKTFYVDTDSEAYVSDTVSLRAGEDVTLDVLQVPGNVLSAAVLMALRTDEIARASGTKKFAKAAEKAIPLSRQLCELFFDALLEPASRKVEVAPQTYERMLTLYTVQVLGTLQHEWNYARDFTGYSSLTESRKNVGCLLQRNTDHSPSCSRSTRHRRSQMRRHPMNRRLCGVSSAALSGRRRRSRATGARRRTTQ